MIRTDRRAFLRVLALGSGAALLTACSQPASQTGSAPASTGSGANTSPGNLIDQVYEAAKKEGKLVWWDQHTLEVSQRYIETFKKKYPGVDVEYFNQTADELKTKAVAEARAGRISFDVIDSGNNYAAYKEAGIFADNSDVILAAGVAPGDIFEGTYSPEYTVNGIAFNPTLVKAEDLPKTWDGFLDPVWKGKLAIETRFRSFVYGTAFMGGEEKVVEYLSKMKEQNPRLTKGDAESNTLLVAGEYPILVGAYLHNSVKYEPKGQPWGFAPLSEVYVGPQGPGYTVPEKAPHRQAGRLFLHWFVGPEGIALMDELRFKGNPAPGSGTGPSKYLEARNMVPRTATLEYEINYPKYEKRYGVALGLPNV
ncbi:MAG TPA: extracellular solute-binding protein [Chloroflexota bacterium]|jgi:iron(III) transport system substrate-binding protein|nr:extracellular solute-binding protein [Chloroflexota bacterium]